MLSVNNYLGVLARKKNKKKSKKKRLDKLE